MKSYPLAILLSCFSLSAISTAAQTSIPVKKLTVFKNGTAMFVKEGNVSLHDGSITLPIPEGVLYGTYFIGSAKDNAVKNIVFRTDTLKRKARCNAVWQSIAANLNKPVTIYYTPTQGVDKNASGRVTEYDLHSGMLKFVTDAGKNLVMYVGSIYQLDFKDDPAGFYMADSVKRMMILKPEKNTDNISLQEIYMTGGINWLPSYFLRIKDDKNARLEMKATLENYAEDLKEADVELVVGAPQMSFSNKLDPMTYDYITSTAQAGGGAGYAAKNYMQSNTMVSFNAESAAPAPGFFESSFETQGEKSGDMYIYKLGKVTLPNRSKGTFPIFAGNIEYKDKYEGTISDFTNYYTNRFVPPDEKPYDIFHSLELKNTSNVPFTTAPVMVVNEKDQFVAQDELKYTPVGANSNIRLSKAVDIVMKNSEDEQSREDNARKIGKTNYSKVIVKGTVNVANYQDKEVVVSITKALNGTVLSQTDNGKVTKKNSYNYINPFSEIKWEVKLSGGEKKTLNYEYEVYFTP